MEKIICMIMSLLMCVMPTAKPQESRHVNWYIKHTNSHEKPVCDSRFSYLDDYDAFYVDINADNENKVIYLTFDAGYENGNIEKILNILKQEKVSAAFFILDHLIYESAALVTRMSDEGHLVCNHTTKHRDMSATTKEEFTEELKKLENLYQERIGCKMAKFYRPPEGKFVEENLSWAQEMGYTTVLWSFAYPDWDNEKQPDPKKAKEKILSNTHPGEILLLHPTSETNVSILKDLIHEWRSMGYRFGSLDELSKSK